MILRGFLTNFLRQLLLSYNTRKKLLFFAFSNARRRWTGPEYKTRLKRTVHGYYPFWISLFKGFCGVNCKVFGHVIGRRIPKRTTKLRLFFLFVFSICVSTKTDTQRSCSFGSKSEKYNCEIGHACINNSIVIVRLTRKFFVIIVTRVGNMKNEKKKTQKKSQMTRRWWSLRRVVRVSIPGANVRTSTGPVGYLCADLSGGNCQPLPVWSYPPLSSLTR